MDYLYLSTTESAYFRNLSEADLSELDTDQGYDLLDKITSIRKRKQVENKLLTLESF